MNRKLWYRFQFSWGSHLLGTLTTYLEGLEVAADDEALPSSCECHVESLRLAHEADSHSACTRVHHHILLSALVTVHSAHLNTLPALTHLCVRPTLLLACRLSETTASNQIQVGCAFIRQKWVEW